jgi:hypothetical protein
LHKLAKPACLKGFQFCRLPGIAGCCVRVRVKLGSIVRELRVVTSFANRIRDWAILGSL